MSTLNNSSFEAIVEKVIQSFNSGKTVIVFKGNNTIVMSNKVHTEATLLKYLNGATTVRICA